MKTAIKLSKTYVLAAAAMLVANGAAAGQSGYGQQSGTWQSGTYQSGMQQTWMSYNPQNETTFRGTVHRVRQEGREDWGKGTHLMVVGDDSVIHYVYLGPQDYLQQNQLEFNRGDEVEITGSRVTRDGRTMVLARQVDFGGRTIALRDPQGAPQWGGADRTAIFSADRVDSAQMTAPVYDLSKETTVRGTIERMTEVSHPGMPASTHAIVRTADGRRVSVKLAPSSYLDQQQIGLKQGDQVEVTGARVMFGSDEGILARQVSSGGRTFTFRSSEGAPLWQESGTGQAERMENTVEYDRSTETTLEGTLQDIRVHDRTGVPQSTHATLRTQDGRTVTVLLGPSNYLRRQGMEFRQGDQVRVTGSRIQFEGRDTLVAREVTRGSSTLMLRDQNGQPKWSTTSQEHHQQMP